VAMTFEQFDVGRRKRLALALGLFAGQVRILGPPDDQRGRLAVAWKTSPATGVLQIRA